MEKAKITIIYDNEAARDDLSCGWGFACLVEAHGRTILFDTGPDGPALLANMGKLGIDPMLIEEVFISHSHADHTAGLDSFLGENPVKVYVPASCSEPAGASEVVKVDEPLVLHPNIMSTGELGGIEQSLALKMEKGTAVVVGCAHPGVGLILDVASQFGEPYAIVGGLHDSREFEALGRLELICGAHCTRYKAEIRALYPDKWVEAGAGRVIEV